MRLNIGVIFGGKSVEHEISIISAIEAMANFDDNKYKVIPIYIDKDNTWYTGEHLKDILHYRDINLVKRYAKNSYTTGILMLFNIMLIFTGIDIFTYTIILTAIEILVCLLIAKIKQRDNGNKKVTNKIYPCPQIHCPP